MNDTNRQMGIRVLVVDDSALMATQIVRILSEDPAIEVIGRAKDGIEALQMVEQLKPDVITLDVEMPRMNGLTALKHIMVKHAIPTVMISALTQEGSRAAFDAFRYGAIDVIAKPSRRHDESLEGQKLDIISKVKRAADIRTGKARYLRISPDLHPPKSNGKGAYDFSSSIIAVGAGTGAYYSLLRIVPSLPPDFDNVIVILLLVAARYAEPFAAYLDAHSVIPVRTVRGVGQPQRGVCYIASLEDYPAFSLTAGASVRFDSDGYPGLEDTGPVDRMLISLAESAGTMAVGVVMSGPGADGADGIVEVRKAGGIAVVQDITNCVDPSMPLAVLRKGSVEEILPDYLMSELFANPEGFRRG